MRMGTLSTSGYSRDLENPLKMGRVIIFLHMTLASGSNWRGRNQRLVWWLSCYDSTQDNSDGFLAERHTCAPINAVSDLISAVTNSKLDLDGISVFDAIPFLHEEVTGLEYDDLIGNAESVFADMIRAKQPNVVISCFKTETCPCPLFTQQLTCSKPMLSSARIQL